MRGELDWSSARTALRMTRRRLATGSAVVYASARRLVDRAVAGVQSAVGLLRSTATSIGAHAAEVSRADATKRLVRRVSRGLVGVRRDVSALTLVVAPLLALVTEQWVARSYGYRRIQSSAVGTWTGTDPHGAVFVAVALLIALAAGFTVVNSGLIPATVLVTGPLFGVGFARYGLAEPYGTVGIPEATTSGVTVAVAFGVPLGLAGFLVGTALRRAIGHFDDRRGLNGGPWTA